jgi:hypothetical protein
LDQADGARALENTRLGFELPSRFRPRTGRPVAQPLVVVPPANLVEDSCPLPHPVSDDLDGFGFGHRSAALLASLHRGTVTRRVGQALGHAGSSSCSASPRRRRPPGTATPQFRRQPLHGWTNRTARLKQGVSPRWCGPLCSNGMMRARARSAHGLPSAARRACARIIPEYSRSGAPTAAGYFFFGFVVAVVAR